jgi:NitT/TauT family transport system substrate-binding protein
VLAFFTEAPAIAAPLAPTTVKVLVPEEGNLQLLAFWVALGAGYFAERGVTVEPFVPPSPAMAQASFTAGETDVALLPAPVYERLIAERFPFVLEANLLSGDPIDLVVPRAIAEARGLRRDLPLADRLRAMRGLRIGVGPHPRPRLAALFASQGLDLDALVSVVVIPGKLQNAALASGEVDALYTHTPFLEDAIVDQHAVLIVDQSGGEVPALAGRQIHALAVTRAFARRAPALVLALVDGIARAERLVHQDPREATNAVLRELPSRDRAHVERLVAIYAAAVPLTPQVSVARIRKELAFFPDGATAPNFTGVSLEPFVAPEPERRPRAGLAARSLPALGMLVGLIALISLWAAIRPREGHGGGRDEPDPSTPGDRSNGA